MQEYIFENGLKLIYKKANSELSSIAISLNAGAGRDGDALGVAHITEHMVYKGTEARTEKEINTELSNVFGFQNAMTNYPYVVFYGTLLSQDLNKGLDIFSDILINPVFTDNSFSEEMEVVKQELSEWDEDLNQYTEDKLYLNCMENRRVKYPIIGTKESLEKLTIDDAIDFFNDYYCADNATMSIITDLDFDAVVDMVDEYFGHWRSEFIEVEDIELQEPKCGIFVEEKEGINSAKVQIIFPIDKLNQWEIKALKIFNQYFGEGVNSVLFDTLRTKHSLVYDVLSKVANEEYIKVYKITYSTSKENVNKSLKIVDEIISNVNDLKKMLKKQDIEVLTKSFKLKRLFADEQSVRLAMQLATYDTMFGDYNLYLDEVDKLDIIPIDFIIETAKKVLSNASIGIVK